MSDEEQFLGDGLLELLRQHGVIVPNETAALLIIDCFLDLAGDKRAAEALRAIRDRLRVDSPHGMAIDRVLFGAFESQRKAAARIGVSHTHLAALEREFKAELKS